MTAVNVLPPVPPVMLNPKLLPRGDYWTWSCPECHACIQGGRAGLDVHLLIVHGSPE